MLSLFSLLWHTTQSQFFPLSDSVLDYLEIIFVFMSFEPGIQPLEENYLPEVWWKVWTGLEESSGGKKINEIISPIFFIWLI